MTKPKVWITVAKGYVVLRWIDPRDGGQKERSLGRDVPEKRRIEEVAVKRKELEEGAWGEPDRISWQAFREEFEEYYFPRVRPATRESYKASMRKVEAVLRPSKLVDLSPRRLAYFESKMRSDGLSVETVRRHLRQLLVFLRWAKRKGLLREVPSVDMPRRVKGTRHAKHTPVSDDDFERLLAATSSVVPPIDVDAWKFFLKGIWLSGLRVGEAANLYWTRTDRIYLDLSGEFPVMAIPAELEKGSRNRTHPLTPDFVDFLLGVPEAQRTDAVFNFPSLSGRRPKVATLGRIASRIAVAANVYSPAKREGDTACPVSLHDLRRSFALRWSTRVMPPVLMRLMRHESADVVLKYYAQLEAQDVARILHSLHISSR